LIRDILDSLKWSSRLGAKFFWAVPTSTSTVVVATLISQVGVLLAFFLPLKVIILLGSDGIPRYFPPAFGQVDRDSLIIGLSAATIAFYLVHLFAERVVKFGAARGAQHLLKRHRKFILFENQDIIASQAYQRYAEAFAGAVFVGLSVLALSVLYPEVTVMLLAYIALGGAFIVTVAELRPSFCDLLNQQLDEILRLLAGIGFLLTFAWLVVDFLFREPPGLISAVIALLLSRQMLNKLVSSTGQLRKLYTQRDKLDALFFHSIAFVPAQSLGQSRFESLIQPERRSQWIPYVLTRVGIEDPPSDSEGEWWSADARDNASFKVECAGGKRFIIKLFGLRATGKAEHEASLLFDKPKGLPAPRWVGYVDVEGHHCHVFELAMDVRVPGEGVTKSHILDVRRRLVMIAPSRAMRERYTRSRALVPQRLNKRWLERLRPAADIRQRNVLEQLDGHMKMWQERLSSLPVVYNIFNIREDCVCLEGAEQRSIVLSWIDWEIDSVGAGWPDSKWYWSKVKEMGMVGEARESDVLLSAFTASLERQIRNGRLLRGLESVQVIYQIIVGDIEDIDGYLASGEFPEK